VHKPQPLHWGEGSGGAWPITHDSAGGLCRVEPGGGPAELDRQRHRPTTPLTRASTSLSTAIMCSSAPAPPSVATRALSDKDCGSAAAWPRGGHHAQ
jgi:hypothetical protein